MKMDDLLRQGIDLAQVGHRADATRLLRSVVYQDPSSIVAWKWLASVTDDPYEALEATERILRLDPNDAWALQAILTYRQQVHQLQSRQPARPVPVFPPPVQPIYQSQPLPQTPPQSTRKQRDPLVSIAIGLSGILVTLVVLAGMAYIVALTFQEEQQAEVGSIDVPEVENAPTLEASGEQAVIPTALPIPQPTRVPTAVPAPPGESLGVEPQVVTSTDKNFYVVRGTSEEAVRNSLYQNGPYVDRLGTRALGLTTYEMSVNWAVLQLPGVCRVSEMVINLDILYTLPTWQPGGSPPSGLQAEWRDFESYVTGHEETHGEIAISCAEGIADQIANLPQATDCGSLTNTVNNVIDAGYRACESQQIEFDRVYGQTTFPLP